MISGNEKVTWRNSAWTVVAGSVLAILLLVVFLTSLTHRHPILHACRNNLYTIAGAKAAWAKDNNKSLGDTAELDDLFGPNKYITGKLSCPSGGTYTIGTVAEKPRCSISSHTI